VGIHGSVSTVVGLNGFAFWAWFYHLHFSIDCHDRKYAMWAMM